MRSQSLLHQVCVRPRSSEQSSAEIMSQSLLHQVCVRPRQPSHLSRERRLNPFFIRSAFAPLPSVCWLFRSVSIPSSSGLRSPLCRRYVGYSVRSQSLLHQVFVRPKGNEGHTIAAESQSLLHQVCVRPHTAIFGANASCLNPFFIRSAFAPCWSSISNSVSLSQSLLHQVCVRPWGLSKDGPFGKVSIPSSSGLRSPFGVFRRTALSACLNPFFIRSAFALYLPGYATPPICLNPFFIRSAFAPGQRQGAYPPTKSQSLLHQVCVRPFLIVLVFISFSLNPFFIRSAFAR